MGDGRIRNGSLRLPIAWLCDASGDFSVELANYQGYNIESVQTIPGLNGDRATTVPSPDYDVVFNDEYSFDIMEGNLADQSESVAATIYADPPVPVPGVITIVISNAGNAKTGLIVIMLKQKR